MMTHSVGLKGKWHIVLRGEDNEIKQQITGDNVTCTNGKNFLGSFLYSSVLAASTFTMNYVAIGSNNTAATAADVALGSETARVTGTASYVTAAIFQVTALFGAGVATGNIYEYGLASVPTAACGTLMSHDVEPLITKGASDTLTVTCQLTMS